MKALIVDDHADARILLHDLLESRGHEVLQAEDGEAALGMARREHPDLVISDVLMPRMDGYELCRHIKTDPELSQTAFVFYSATFVEPGDEHLARELGAARFIRLPIEPDDFMAIIQTVMNERRSVPQLPPAEITRVVTELQLRHDRLLSDKLLQKNRELETLQQSLTTLLGNLPGMVYRCRNDPDWTMEFVSEGCQALTGYPPESLLGNRDASYGGLIHPDDRERIWREVQSAHEAGSPFQFEYRIRHRDGALRWAWEQGRCIRTGDGSALLEGYVTDITTQRRAEAEHNRFFELSIDLLCIAGTDGHFRQLNPAWSRILGWSEAELLARPWLDFVHPEDREATERVRVELADGREIFSFENRYRHRDGGFRWLSWNAMPLPEEGLLFGVARDVTDRIEAEQQLKRLNRALHTLSAGNRALVHFSDETLLLNEMCRVAVKEGGYLMAWVGYAMEDEGKSIRPIARYGVYDDYLERLHLSWADNEDGRGPAGRAIRERETQVVQDIQTDPAMARWREHAASHGYVSLIALPLSNKARTFGALIIYGTEAGLFMPEEVLMLEELAGDLAYGITSNRTQAEKIEAETRLQESLVQTIQAIAMTVEKRDPYTAGHQNRVAQLAAAIAAEMQLPEDQVNGIRLGAMIHDIGKIYVPSEILNRPGRLSSFEFEIIKTHPDVGYDIIKDARFPWPIAQMIHQHHERLDGSGYPQGLKGDEILLDAKIMAVADVVEAITAHRPYRPAMGLDKALEEIIAKRGIGFMPEAVDACVRLVREGRFAFS
jgi:PAS domain S-box-containing protein/putative nucleotidyltransferase with HDIG domain